MPKEWFEEYERQSINIFKELNFSEPYFWFDLAVIELFKTYGFPKFKYLAIWDKDWIIQMKEFLIIKDPRNLFIKVLHLYLRTSQRFYPGFTSKVFDKILKSVVKK